MFRKHSSFHLVSFCFTMGSFKRIIRLLIYNLCVFDSCSAFFNLLLCFIGGCNAFIDPFQNPDCSKMFSRLISISFCNSSKHCFEEILCFEGSSRGGSSILDAFLSRSVLAVVWWPMFLFFVA
eukprot:257404_1